jgi:aspartate ammonia-lyase
MLTCVIAYEGFYCIFDGRKSAALDIHAAHGGEMRTEKDFIGSRDISEDSPFGIHTLRASENFACTDEHIMPELFRALIEVKCAAARANREAKLLDDTRAVLIEKACRIILESIGDYIPPIDPLQGGAGTSTNMAANELVANFALKEAGRKYGEYGYIDPLAHINLSQSTNDAYPTAVRIAIIRSLRALHDSCEMFLSALIVKEKEFSGILKIGRTEMQEAMPLSLGSEFGAWAESMARFRWRLSKGIDWVREVNISGTAVGTGINADRTYASAVIRELREISHEPLSFSRNLIDGTQNIDQIVEVSGIVKSGAVSVKKICADLRLLSSGPRSGFAEIILPQMQAGSSIMPGKVNPVICEALEQICLSVISGDQLVSIAAAESNLELPQFLPLIAHTVLKHNRMLTKGLALLARHVAGIKANEKMIRYHLERSTALATLLSPAIGYDTASAIVKEAEERDMSIADLVVEKGLLTRERLEELMRPEVMAAPGIIDCTEDTRGD